ncbi:energy-coupling factor ABC transporter ATP-binding protein [Alkaliphilus peptidifermentans]|uniref:Cobalt/nickel transport system ATP-binding protein n=1 Tax=Alkaliphilus peptidifermentans DSM 18978 TaxID=1120976 RepID=A0A1G5KMA4_9FIRM|nr:energy-coupling factor ABC transporter ATP-binding protein [Alkaliphilus peptidifermentans]SCZ01238.1 cobalt/nickel transport system ATP-binding protein [Alkaliphilus peptidifermentans DSM 18978]
MEPLIKVQCLKHIYPDKTEVNICGLNFEVFKGERIVILGPNGAGKTTLLSHILGLLKPVDGIVEVMGLQPSKNFNTIRKKIGVVFQNADEQIIGPRVYDDIAFTPRNEGLSKNEIDEMVRNVAESLGIADILEKIPHYLSGGQKKKVALAGSIVMMPEILIMDEPFESLDPKSKTEMVSLLNHLNSAHGITTITTTHDINVVPEIADKIYVIDSGNIIAAGSPMEIFSNVDVIKRAKLEPPILTELFSRLERKGYGLGIPKNMEEAENILLNILEEINPQEKKYHHAVKLKAID